MFIELTKQCLLNAPISTLLKRNMFKIILLNLILKHIEKNVLQLNKTCIYFI